MRREGARASERSSSAQAANSGSEKSWARIATNGPKHAGTSNSSASASARSRAPERRASRASSASVPADGRHLRDLHSPAPERREQREDQLPEHRDVRPAVAWRRMRRERRPECRRARRSRGRARPATGRRPPDAEQRRKCGDRESCEPARARQGAQRVATPWKSAHGSQRSRSTSPFGQVVPNRRFVVFPAPSPQSVGGSPVFGRKWVRPDVMGRAATDSRCARLRGAGGHPARGPCSTRAG